MKAQLHLIILGLLIGSQAFSQKQEITFGELSRQEIEMTEYAKDKEAKAVVLYDKGESVFIDTDRGYDIRFTRHKRIKIFDKTASEHAEISIPFFVDGFGKTEDVKSIEAVTYNFKNGRMTRKKLDPSAIYEEQVNERWFQKKFVFPDVQDGSILEFKYVLETPFHFNLPDWKFQDRIPTIYSEYKVSMIPFYEYIFLAQGITSFDYQNSVISDEDRTWGNVSKVYGKNVGSGIEFQDYIHTYVLKDVPAFKDESYISSVNDYIVKIDFQLAKFHSPDGGHRDVISTWPDLNESLLKHDDFGKYLKKGSRFAKKVLEKELDLEGLDENQKAVKIVEYVKNSFEWDGYNSKYTSRSVRDFIERKKGNAADINLFLIALLNEAGIAAEPVILSTRNHGKIPFDYPFDHFTNYVIALVHTGAPFLADGTEDLLAYNMLPTRCLNEKGLVVNEDKEPKWIRVSSNLVSLERKLISLTIDSLTLDARTKVSIQSMAYESFANRRKFSNDTSKIKKFYAEKIGTINKMTTYGYQNKSFPYSMNFQGAYETEKLGENIIVKPFLDLPLAKNQLKQDKRSYPVDFVYPWEEQFESTLEIPEGYALADMPASFSVDNELAEIVLTYTASEESVTAKGNYRFKKAVYAPSEYSKIRQSLDQVVKHFNQPIVLEKVN